MKVYVDLTDNELRALRTCLVYSNRCCLSGCSYPEMQQRKVECHNCEFTKNVDKVIKKFNNLQSLSNYTKKVRKEVCEKMRKYFDKNLRTCEEYDCCGFGGIDIKDIYKFLDQIQGETDGSKN